jgi:two-component system LytT family response regulator
MIKAILVDDEAHSCDILSWKLKEYCPEVSVIDSCTDPFKAIESVKLSQPDVLFVDIEMPGMSGFELLQRLMPVNFDIIFVTAFDQFAIKAFEYSAVDYLLKPVEAQDLIKAVARVKPKENLDEQRLQLLLAQLGAMQRHEKVKRLAVATFDSYHFINVDDIVCCQSERNYSYIHLVDGKKILISKTLKVLENILEPNSFFRIQQSYLINLDYVKKFNRDSGGYVIMENGLTVTVAKNKRDEFFSKFSKI